MPPFGACWTPFLWKLDRCWRFPTRAARARVRMLAIGNASGSASGLAIKIKTGKRARGRVAGVAVHGIEQRKLVTLCGPRGGVPPPAVAQRRRHHSCFRIATVREQELPSANLHCERGWFRLSQRAAHSTILSTKGYAGWQVHDCRFSDWESFLAPRPARPGIKSSEPESSLLAF